MRRSERRHAGARRRALARGRRDDRDASAAASSSCGSRPGIVRASSVLPTPGGPIISMPCPPARAISSPRRASGWPRTSARSGRPGARREPRQPRSQGLGRHRRGIGARSAALRRALAAADRPTGPGSTASAEASPARHVDARRPAALPRPRRGDHDAPHAAPRQRRDHRQDAGDRPHLATERSSPISATRARSGADLLRPKQDPERDREVERRAGLAQLGRREVDRDPPRRIDEASVADRPAYTLACLLERGVGQADDGEAGQPGATSTSTRMSRPSRPWSVADGTMASTTRSLAARAHPARVTAAHPALTAAGPAVAQPGSRAATASAAATGLSTARAKWRSDRRAPNRPS